MTYTAVKKILVGKDLELCRQYDYLSHSTFPNPRSSWISGAFPRTSSAR